MLCYPWLPACEGGVEILSAETEDRVSRGDAGSPAFSAVQISMCIESIGYSDRPHLQLPGGIALRSLFLFCMVRDLYCLYLLMKEVSGTVFIYSNNFISSEKLCSFVITNFERVPENGRKPL